MKVLQVINNLDTGGAEKLLVDIIPKLVKESIHVELLLLNGKEFSFLKELHQNNFLHVHSLSKGSVYNPLLVFKIIPFLRRFHIIHVHLFPSLYWVALAKLLTFSKTKLIFTEHNTYNRRLNNFFYRLLDRWIYKYYYGIICVTDEVKKILLKHINFNQEKLIVIENGIDLNNIYNANPLLKKKIHAKLFKGDKILIQVAGFRKQKDQKTLIKAVKLLSSNVKLILVGDGVLRSSCERLVMKLGLEERIFFLGVRDDIPQLLKSSDIVVLSSKYEGLSLSSIEGMASGRPFIASNVPGLEEIVKGAGILVSQGDEITLANEITKLLNDEKYYIKVCSACLKKAAQYNIDFSVKKHLKFYKKIYNMKSN